MKPSSVSSCHAPQWEQSGLPALTHHGYTVWRQNTTGTYDVAKARWRVTRQEGPTPQGRRGVLDIIGVEAGCDRLRDEQREFLNELK